MWQAFKRVIGKIWSFIKLFLRLPFIVKDGINKDVKKFFKRFPTITKLVRISVFTFCMGIAMSFFYPQLRLYYSGEVKFCKIDSVATESTLSQKDKFYAFWCKDTPGIILSAETNKKFNSVIASLKRGDSVVVLYSRALKYGVVILDSKYKKTLLFLSNSALVLYIFVPLSIISLIVQAGSLMRKKLKERFHLIQLNIPKNFIARGVYYVTEFVPLTAVIAFFTVFGLFAIKSVLSVEKSFVFGGGMVISIAFSVILFFPVLYIAFLNLINKYDYLAIIKSIIKLLLSVWGLIRLYIFMTTEDLTKYKNVLDAMTAAFEFLIP